MVTVGDWYEVWVPARWRDFAGRPEAIKAHRAELCDNIRDTVVAALSADDVLAEKVGYTASAVSRWKSERRFSRLAREWPQGHELWPELELWRQRDKHLWEFEANERDQIIARRNDLYRKIAAWVADSARVIAIKDVAITNVKRKPVLGEEDTYQARGGRKQIQFAAPGTLREHLVSAAAARGVTVLTYSSETTSEDGND